MSDDFADRLFEGTASREETAGALRAALLDDDAPHDAPLPTVDELAPRPGAAAYGGALDRALDAAAETARAADAEERRVSADRDRVAALPPAERLATVEGEERLHTWAFVESLCEASLSACFDRPGHAVELAELAVAAAEARRRGEAGDGRLDADLCVLAWAQLANARRVTSDLHAAESAFGTARQRLADGTGDPLVRARLLSLEASLASDRQLYAEAIALAERAARLYRRLGDDHGYGRTRFKQATFEAFREELETACELLTEALAHVDRESEPRLVSVAHHNRASYLDRLGRHDEAARELAAAEPLATAPLDRVRWEWLAGRVAGHRGDAERGERLLLAARDAFMERGVGYDFALVSLDLAALYAEQGRSADMKRLAEEMLPIFASRDLAPAAQAALKVYCDAAVAETAGRGLVREVVSRLRRLERGA